MAQAIKFDVVDRSNLPLELSTTGKYGPLVAAAAKLNGKEVICVTDNFKQTASFMYYKIKHDSRLAGLKFSQIGGKLWIFRPAK